MVPALVSVVTPPLPLLMLTAMPLRPLIEVTPRLSRPLMPLMVPPAWLFRVTLLPAALDSTTPLEARLSRPSTEGSMVPALFTVTPVPVRLSAAPRPSVAPMLPVGVTLSFRSFCALE